MWKIGQLVKALPVFLLLGYHIKASDGFVAESVRSISSPPSQKRDSIIASQRSQLFLFQSIEDADKDIPSSRSYLSRRNVLGRAAGATIGAIGFALESGAADGTTNGRKRGPRVGGLADKIRGILKNMDELQRDLMQERWDLVQNYPPQLRSYVPVFTTYTDAAFPSDLPSDYGLRVALRYEVGRFFASLERFKRAVARKSLEEAYVAYSDMSLHLDRYLRVGGLYTYYDSTIDNEQLFKGYDSALVYADPVKDPAEVRDLVVLCKGPDKGKTGIVIGIYPGNANDNTVVKLDRVRGMREIRVVPRAWAAKRLGEQDPDDVFLIPRKRESGYGVAGGPI